MHGRLYVLHEFLYGFSADQLFLRVDPFAEAIEGMKEFQLRITIWDLCETRITLRIEESQARGRHGRTLGRMLAEAEAISALCLRQNHRN